MVAEIGDCTESSGLTLVFQILQKGKMDNTLEKLNILDEFSNWSQFAFALIYKIKRFIKFA